MNEDSRSAPSVTKGTGVTRCDFVAGGAALGGGMTVAQSGNAAAATTSQPARAGAHWPEGVRLPITISMMWEAGAEPMPMIQARFVPPDAAGKSFPISRATASRS